MTSHLAGSFLIAHQQFDIFFIQLYTLNVNNNE